MHADQTSTKYLLEEAGGEAVEVAAPGVPFVGGGFGFVDDVLDASFIEEVVRRGEGLDEAVLRCAGAHPEEVDAFVEIGGAFEDAVVGGVEVGGDGGAAEEAEPG